ncbi:MAG: isoprenyl transferase [Candidatus Omnitrophota bacterium]
MSSKLNLDPKTIPQHVAIIMDGNGRWAKKQGLPRSEGHKKGVERVREIVEEAARLKIKVLTLYAFSTENWKRPKKEINLLMRLLKVFLNKEIKNFNKNNIRFECIGRISQLPASVIESLERVRHITKNNNGLILNLALNYGSRPEIIDALNNIIKDYSSGRLNEKNIDENIFSQYLYTKNLPDPDLLIRTSGEQRVSNFLLWQISYAELFFSKKLWPDFSADDFFEAILEYQNRARRFGGI